MVAIFDSHACYFSTVALLTKVILATLQPRVLHVVLWAMLAAKQMSLGLCTEGAGPVQHGTLQTTVLDTHTQVEL